MAESDINKPPRPNACDAIHTLTKAGISAIPVIGGPVSELFSLVVTPSLEKRLDEWRKSVAETLKVLEEKVEGFKIENLQGNEVFITVVMEASRIAIRNHQKEKLEALKNVVLNTTLPSAPEEDLQLMFLNFVDSLTSWHLRMLKLLDNYKARRPSSRSTGVRLEFVAKSKEKTVITTQKALPELGDHQIFYDQVLKDLRIRGLLEYDMTDQASFLDKIIYAQPTNLGKQLLAFISSPFASHKEADSGGKAEAKE